MPISFEDPWGEASLPILPGDGGAMQSYNDDVRTRVSHCEEIAAILLSRDVEDWKPLFQDLADMDKQYALTTLRALRSACHSLNETIETQSLVEAKRVLFELSGIVSSSYDTLQELYTHLSPVDDNVEISEEL